MIAWSRIFGCDLRALAAFRVIFGLAVGTELVAQAGGQGPSALQWLGALTAILLCLGYQTRVAAVLTWLVLLAVSAQVPELPDQATRLFFALSFVSMFLPLGARYSLDVAVDPEPHTGQHVTSLATFAILVQTGWLFVGSILARWFVLDANPSGASLDVHSALVGMIALITLLPSAPFDALAKAAAGIHRGGLRIYYDGDCGFCKKTCLIFRTFLLLGDTPIFPAQNDPEAHAIMQRLNSWVVFDFDGETYVRWHAVLLLLRRSLLFRPIGLGLTAVGMGRWCDWLYGVIAGTRGWWSFVTARMLPYRHIDIGGSRAVGVVLMAWMAAILLFNAGPEFVGEPAESRWWQLLADGFAINQKWYWLGTRAP